MTVIINGTDNAVGNPAIQGGTGGTTTGLYYPAANTVAITTGGVNAVYITNAQKVGFNGQTTPSGTIDINGGTFVTRSGEILGSASGSNTSSLTLNAGNAFAGGSGAGFVLRGAGSGYNPGYIEWYIPVGGNTTEQMRMDSAGNLMVGTTSQSGKLTVVNAGDVISAKTLSNNNYSNFIGYNLSGSATFVVSGAGAVTKASGTFRIEHPLPEKSATHDLVHSFIEGPNADLIYRGKVSLINGKATVNIDKEARMTEGTFVLLCRNVQCFTTNETDWTAVRGSVSKNILTIEAQDNTSTANISWMVIGERQDKHMYDTDWTDDNGRPIIEPLKKVDAQAAEIAELKAGK